jgi:L-alanine-DL-glutamate epimerase-like enolase superfamily enzyme
MLDLFQRFPSPIEIASIEVWQWQGKGFIRTTSREGVVGIANANQHFSYLVPILQQRVIPYFVGQDARDLESLVDGVYTFQSNYKLAGLALWSSVGYVELSIWDMLGKAAGLPVGALLGTVIRRQIPVYLSSGHRDTTPEEEVGWLSQRLAETGARAVKVKVGGRMSQNADAFPGRTERLIALARETWGPDVAIYVDANGSYDAEKGIEVGQMLQAYGVAFLEEPCPFDEYEQTKQVADALDMPVAGGEQDSSMARFRWMIEHRGVDVVQPDMLYNGGLIRSLRVANMAAQANVPVTPHCPKADPNSAYMLHFGSVVPNLGPHQEYNAYGPRSATWFAPSFDCRDGVVEVPAGPGLGVEYDPSIWAQGERL